jgi:outer membrane protein OmpA-like peptidoglycan-associated protein
MKKFHLSIWLLLVLSSRILAQEGNPFFSSAKTNFNSELAEIGMYKNAGNNELILVSTRPWGIVKYVDAKEQHFFNYFSVDPINNKVSAFQKSSNSKFNEGALCFTPDGRTVFFTRNAKQKSKGTASYVLMLYYASVDNKGRWSNIQPVNFNNASYSVGHPAVTMDGKSLIFASDMPGGFGGTDLYTVDIESTGNFGTPVNLGQNINTSGNELFPWFNMDNQLFFASNGREGLGGFDLYVTETRSGKEPFTPMNLQAPINSSSDDIAIVYHSEVKGYFCSNRSQQNDDVFAFTQLRPIVFKVVMSGTITNTYTNDTLKEAELFIKNESGEVVATVKSDDKGFYSVNLEPDQNYTVEVKKEAHKEESFQLSTDFNTPKVNQNVQLEGKPTVEYTGQVTDAKTGEPLGGVQVTMKDATNGQEVFNGIADSLGTFAKKFENLAFGKQQRFNLKLEKKDYATKTVSFSFEPKISAKVSINEFSDLSIGKVEVGVDLSKIMDLGDIFFDYGKFDIRQDAMAQLDKIVGIMNEYPAMVIELGSHTDCRGAKEANKTLSDNRANASADYIKSRISNPTRISGVGYGEAKLKVNCPCEGKVVSNCPEEEHAKNRRTEFIVKKVK